MIKLQTKKVLCVAVAVGHVKMTDYELVYNIHLVVNFWSHCSRKIGRISGFYTLTTPRASPSTYTRKWKWSCSVVSDSLRPRGLCSPPGSSVHGILQARRLEWVAISFSRGSSQLRDRIHIFCILCIGRWIFYPCATWEDLNYNNTFRNSSIKQDDGW